MVKTQTTSREENNVQGKKKCLIGRNIERGKGGGDHLQIVHQTESTVKSISLRIN